MLLHRMSNIVSIHPYFQTQEGKLEDFIALLPEFIAATKDEEKCHWYDFSISESGVVHCREAYDGADGLLTHIGNVEALIGQALTFSDLVRVEVHGPAAELAKLKEPLKDLNPDYFTFHSGVDKS